MARPIKGEQKSSKAQKRAEEREKKKAILVEVMKKAGNKGLAVKTLAGYIPPDGPDATRSLLEELRAEGRAVMSAGIRAKDPTTWAAV
jgi:hypothetical protein